jgi:hypothetical protein
METKVVLHSGSGFAMQKTLDQGEIQYRSCLGAFGCGRNRECR